MVGAFHMLGDEPVKLGVALQRCARLNFLAPERVKGRLAKNLSGQAYAMAKITPILRIGHIVEQDFWIFGRITGAQSHCPARGRSHGPDMGLEPMTLRGGAPIIAHGDRQEMILNVWVAYTRL